MKNTRRGLGKGLGSGYKNIIPIDAHIHSLSAKGVKLYAKVGDRVRVNPDNDNENYRAFKNKTLIVTHVATNREEHPFYDEGLKGGKLYDFVDEKGNEIPFSLYDYEIEELSGLPKRKNKKLDARGNMHTIQIDPEYSVLFYSEGTRNGFRHVAILMRNGYEVEKATMNYLNRTWESYDFQSVIHKLFDKAFDESKAKVLKEDLDKASLSYPTSLYKLSAKGNKNDLYQCPTCGKLHFTGSNISRKHSRQATKYYKDKGLLAKGKKKSPEGYKTMFGVDYLSGDEMETFEIFKSKEEADHFAKKVDGSVFKADFLKMAIYKEPNTNTYNYEDIAGLYKNKKEYKRRVKQ